MRTRRWRTIPVVALTLGVGACDGPDGPGTVSGTVTGDPQLGAVVLDVTWRGIQGFQGLGSTQVYFAPVAGTEGRYRVVLVDPVGGDLRFGIDVDDVYLEGPIVTLVAAAGTDDQTKPLADLEVRLER